MSEPLLCSLSLRICYARHLDTLFTRAECDEIAGLDSRGHPAESGRAALAAATYNGLAQPSPFIGGMQGPLVAFAVTAVWIVPRGSGLAFALSPQHNSIVFECSFGAMQPRLGAKGAQAEGKFDPEQLEKADEVRDLSCLC